MNKLYALLLLAVVCTGISSCKKEDNKEVAKAFSVTGNWRTTAVEVNYLFKEQSVDKVTLNLNQFVDHITFKADGTGEMLANGKTIRKFSYTFTKDDIHFASVFSLDGTNWVSSPSFMFFINSATDTGMSFTQQDFFFNHPQYAFKEYDKTITSIKVVKE